MDRKRTLGFLLLITGLWLTSAGLAYSRPGWAAPLPGGAQATAGAPAGPTGALAPAAGALTGSDVIRLHVVANSDSDADQALKRAVRDAILAEVTPLFTADTTAAGAEAEVARSLPAIEAAAARVVAAAGKDYAVSATVGDFDFPGRSYGTIYLPAGRYRALRVLIGAAQGANWWCVLFPPVCFVDWAAGVVLEPRPGSGGTETITVARGAQGAALLDEEQLRTAPVRVRFAVWEWARRRLH